MCVEVLDSWPNYVLWLEPQALSLSLMDSEALQYATPHPPKFTTCSHLSSQDVAGFVWSQHCPVFITALSGYPPCTRPHSPPLLAPAPLPHLYRNVLGLVIAFVETIELYTADWNFPTSQCTACSLNGAQRGATLQPTDAAKFQQWCSTITPTQAPVHRLAGGDGTGREARCAWDVTVMNVCTLLKEILEGI